MLFDIDISSPYFQFGAMLVVASLIGLICHRLKQPLFFAYLATGMLVGAVVGSDLAQIEGIHLFSELGIAFLLFLIGLEFNLKDIRHIGRVGLVAGLGQIAIVGSISFVIATGFGLSWLPALYVALAMTFASMVITVKYLNDHRATETLYGKVDLMMHLVQAVVAVLALIILSSVAAVEWQNKGDLALWVVEMGLMLSKAGVLLLIFVYLNQTILPRLFKSMAGSSELLILASIAWCVFGSGIAFVMGFSVEVGAFLAGLALSTTGLQYHVTGKIKPIRDFFVVVFFIALGWQVTQFSLLGVLVPALILSAVVLLLNPLVSMVLLGRLGYKRHTAFFASVLMNQIGEFSVILAALGVSLGHLNPGQGSLITATVLITMMTSSFIIRHEQRLYRWARPYLSWIEWAGGKEKRVVKRGWKDHVVVLGAHRLGSDVLYRLRQESSRLLAIDYDPSRVRQLELDGFEVIYGDAVDETVLQEAGVDRARLVISTIESHQATLDLLKLSQANGWSAPLVVTAANVEPALEYYGLGAAYVIIPMLIGAQAVTEVVIGHLGDLQPLEPARLQHLQFLAIHSG